MSLVFFILSYIELILAKYFVRIDMIIEQSKPLKDQAKFCLIQYNLIHSMYKKRIVVH